MCKEKKESEFLDIIIQAPQSVCSKACQLIAILHRAAAWYSVSQKAGTELETPLGNPKRVKSVGVLACSPTTLEAKAEI